MEKISENFSLAEATKSVTAIKHGLDNTPTPEQVENLKALAEHVLEPLRKVSGNKPINTVVMFRNGKKQKTIYGKWDSVNALVGGDPLSQHQCYNGDAAGDFDNDGLPDRETNAELFMSAYNNMEVDFDKVIAENVDDNGHVDWLHISHNRKRKQRRLSMVMFFCMKKGKKEKVYRNFDMSKGLERKNYLLPDES